MGNTPMKVFKSVTKAAALATVAVLATTALATAAPALALTATATKAIVVGAKIAGCVGAAAGAIGGAKQGYNECVQCCSLNVELGKSGIRVEGGHPAVCTRCDSCEEHCKCKR